MTEERKAELKAYNFDKLPATNRFIAEDMVRNILNSFQNKWDNVPVLSVMDTQYKLKKIATYWGQDVSLCDVCYLIREHETAFTHNAVRNTLRLKLQKIIPSECPAK